MAQAPIAINFYVKEEDDDDDDDLAERERDTRHGIICLLSSALNFLHDKTSRYIILGNKDISIRG